jgi:hypothetical protein
MTVLARFGLFLSSYAPLFGVFSLLDSFGPGIPTVVCIVLTVIGMLLPFVVLTGTRSLVGQDLPVKDTQIRDGDVLAYIATYLVPFAAITATTGRERGALGLFVFLIAVIYIRSELFYINPLLALAGFRLFQVGTTDGASVVLLSRKRFLGSNITLKARRLSDYVYWEVKG